MGQEWGLRKRGQGCTTFVVKVILFFQPKYARICQRSLSPGLRLNDVFLPNTGPLLHARHKFPCIWVSRILRMLSDTLHFSLLFRLPSLY